MTALAQTLRGFGRQEYRNGGWPHTAVQFAELQVGRLLSERERELVIAGWRDERSEAVRS